MSIKYKKFRSFLLPKEMVDFLFVSAHVSPLEDNKESEIIVGLAVIDDILSKSNQNRKFEDYSFHFIPMASTYLQLKYGNNYKNYFHWLIIRNIVWRDESHEGKATSYYLHSMNAYLDFTSRLLKENDIKTDEIKEIIDTYCIRDNIEITLETLTVKGILGNQKSRIYDCWCRIKVPITKTNRKFLTRDYEQDSKYINNAPKHIKKMGSHYRKNLAIDYDSAMTHTVNRYNKELTESKNSKDENSAYKRYSSRVLSINAINNGSVNKSLRFTRNTTNNRLDTNLTNMASDLKVFIIGYKKMTYLDLSNSQPVLFNIMLKNYQNTASKELQMEMELYFNVTLSGRWYEWLQNLYGLSRDECKEIWMQIAYSKNDHYAEVKKVFMKALPNIYALIEKIKEQNHAQFAIDLQIVESKIFIDEICRELVNQNIIPYTIHDGLLVPNKHQHKTLEIMSAVLEKNIGAVPNIKIENHSVNN